MTASRELQVLASASFSSVGKRPAQEDHLLILDQKRIFVVADGFGGPVPGAAAAKEACEAVKSFLVREAGDLDATLPFVLRSYFSLAGNVLFNALIHANRRVKRLNRDKGVHERGGASVIAGYMDGDLLALANVGGCTAWLFRDGQAKEMVTPRTYGRLIEPLQRENGRDELQVPLMALGISEDLEPEIFECKVQRGDWLLFHTDGMTESVRDRILRIQAESVGSMRPVSELRRDAERVLSESEYSDNAAAALIFL